jgi:hypothetical protein
MMDSIHLPPDLYGLQINHEFEALKTEFKELAFKIHPVIPDRRFVSSKVTKITAHVGPPLKTYLKSFIYFF